MRNPNEDPLVSVILPAYNAEKYISEAIESILSQTLESFELIIIDDCSDDSTSEIVATYSRKDPRIKYLRNDKNLNIGGSLNRGIESAKSDFVARMDADDVSLPNRLKFQYEALANNPNVAVIGANIQVIDERGKIIGDRRYPTSSKSLKRVMFRYSPFAHPVVMFRKKCFEEFGGYDASKSPSEDLDLWFKLGTKYNFMSIPEPLLKYRVFLDSSSNKKLRRVERLTLQLRFNAVKNLGYKISLVDLLYNILQLFSLYLMPIRVRVKAFNFLRNKNLI